MKRALLHVGVVALLAFFIGFATAATGKAPTEFRGIKWGSHPTSALKRIGGPSDDPEKLETWTNRNKKLPDFSGIPVAEEGYSFAAGKLYGGQLYIDGDANFTNAKSELIKRFGPPDFSNDSAKIYKWNWATASITVTLSYQAKFQRTTIYFRNKSF